MSERTPSESEVRLQAYLDGELPEAEARAFEARLDADPAAARDLAAFRAIGDGLRRAAGGWEEGADFEGFSAAVMARLPREGTPAPAPVRLGLWTRFSEWLAGHPALAAAATILIVLGAGSVLYLELPGSHPGPVPALQLRGGATQIEDLSFESGSAVVYKTEGEVTVIWISEDDAP